MIIVDASAAVSGLLNDGAARELLVTERVGVPHLIDSEVANALRRHVLTSVLSLDRAWAALDTWRRLGITRYPIVGLMMRIWSLRDNLSAYDATYVSLAEHLECPLLTADARLAAAPDIGCPIISVPR